MTTESSDPEQCWICLDDASEDGNKQLIAPCKCPRRVHPQCLARWQLQQAGKHEEKFCRFCNNSLADWKANLTPKELAPEVSKVQPIMVVYFEGQIHRIPVKQGPDGLAEFQSKIRDLFKLPEDVDISLTFGCKEPMSGQHLKLEGVGAFDAAVHCASVAAADRQQKVRRSMSASDPTSAVPGAAAPGDISGAPHSAGGAAPHSAGGAAPHSAGGAPPPPPQLRRSTAGMHPAGPLAVAAPLPLPPVNASGRRSHSMSARAAGPAAPPSGLRLPSAPVASPFAAPALQHAAPPQQHPAPGQHLPSTLRGMLAAISGVDGTAPAPRTATYATAHRTAVAAAAVPSASSPPPPRSPEYATAAAGRASGGGAVAAAAAGQTSVKHERLSSRAITELTDVPAADETVAVGSTDSVGGRLKLTLKAFSRKVARSLSFTQQQAAEAAAAAAATVAAAAASRPGSFGGAGRSLLPPAGPRSRSGSAAGAEASGSSRRRSSGSGSSAGGVVRRSSASSGGAAAVPPLGPRIGSGVLGLPHSAAPLPLSRA